METSLLAENGSSVVGLAVEAAADEWRGVKEPESRARLDGFSMVAHVRVGVDGDGWGGERVAVGERRLW